MRLQRANERRGVILLVVLSLLTLFAIVGITFVLYSDSEATAARIAREAESQQRADVDPEQALAFFLGQLIYDVNDNDVSGVGSGLRGHSLARTMYGNNYPALGVPGVNTVPFNGVGRLHYGSQFGQDDYTLVNYTWFSGDGFLRDPERYGTRASPAAAQGNSYVGGNAPYTYPDLNNFYLAAVNAYGQVLTPSYHRAWLFNPGMALNNMTNPNWTSLQGKYLTLRPRPNEHPLFPIPDDATGDVKNLLWTEGGNDSIWIDLGAPVMTAPDGTQYKMLFAPLIVDLDGRINLNTAGNILGPGNTHVSNQGWGPWEVNLAKVLNGDQVLASSTPPTEYINLFTGTNLGTSAVFGRYGTPRTPIVPVMPAQLTQPGVPTPAGSPAPASTGPHFYAPVDYNGLNETTPPYSSRPVPPGIAPNNGVNPPNPFAMFQQGYLNGGTENATHPLLYDHFRSSLFNGTDNRVFRASDMESLMRPNNNFTQPFSQRSPDSGSAALVSDLLRLCPINLGNPTAPTAPGTFPNPRTRNLVTTLSMDLGTPALSPNWWNFSGTPATTSYLTANPNPVFAPFGQAAPFPPLPPNAGISNALGTSPPTSEFTPGWRASSPNTVTYATNNPFTYMSPGGRIQLNRPLPPFPHMGSGLIPPYGGPVAGAAIGTSYNLGNAAIANQYNAAQNARQALANDIYRRLLALAGIPVPGTAGIANTGTPTAPSSTDLSPRRWLAQLAVNIVDFIDEDDISTPFNFYTTQDTNGAAITTAATQGLDDPGNNPQNQSGNNNTGANPSLWVFGTELPKVVLNEALAEAQNSTPALALLPGGDKVNVWVELYNTMQAPPAAPNMAQQQDGVAVPLYMSGGYSPYRVTIAQTPMNQPPPTAAAELPDTSANVLGKPYIAAPFPVSTSDADFSAANVKTIAQSGYVLVGPTPPTPAANYQDPFPPAGPGVLRTANMSYTPTWIVNPPNPDERTTGLTVMLRRLANPYLPYNGVPGANYNPYVTVDYLQNIPIQSPPVSPVTGNPPNPLPGYNTRGKTQPYAAYSPPNVLNPPYPANPVVNQQTNATPPPQGAVVTNGVTHTFGSQNYPLPPSGHYDWLVHLDRQVISPIELLHVSGYQPYQLTQQFMQGSDVLPANVANMFRHYAPWLDFPPALSTAMSAPWWFDPNPAVGPGGPTATSTHRLSRLFEFLECGDRAFGVNGLGRIPGKVNINTIWDAEVLQALIDANPSIGIPAMLSQRPPNGADPVVQIFNNLMQSRSPSAQYTLASGLCNGAIGPTNITMTPALTAAGYSLDRPFLPLGTGASQVGQQYPNVVGVTTDTLLRVSPTANTQLLLQNPNVANDPHPYLQTQLLAKLYNNVTTRSNTFAVFVTVGFFQVVGTVGNPPNPNNPNLVPSPNVPQLGPEIGRSEGRQVRHRMFAIVDRTNLTVATTQYMGAAINVTSGPVPPATGPQTALLTLAQPIVSNPFTGAAWSLASGVSLVFEPGTDNEETVVAQPAPSPPNPPGTFQATFLKSHAPGVPVTLRGNPGPWKLQPYDPRNDPAVVPYYSIID